MTEELIKRHKDKINGYNSILQIVSLDEEVKEIYDRRIQENSLIIKGLELIKDKEWKKVVGNGF